MQRYNINIAVYEYQREKITENHKKHITHQTPRQPSDL
jgi:hypothetical protein